MLKALCASSLFVIDFDRMANIREKEAYLQLQRQELADKEFVFETERSAVILMRQKY
jgi:hypothetical protein